jgi:hypothetical protein
MALDEIKATAPIIAAVAADDCAFLPWGTWPQLPAIQELIAACGFTYKSNAFLWVKTTASWTAGCGSDGGQK